MNIISQKFEDDKIVGSIKIANEVISTIAGTAAVEVDGVVCTPMETKGAFVEWINKKNLSKGVHAVVEEDEIFVKINLVVKFGYNVLEISKDVQKQVKNALETMVGLKVSQVDVSIDGIISEESKN